MPKSFFPSPSDENSGPLTSLLSNQREARPDPFVLICMPIRKSDRLEQFYLHTIVPCFQPELEVKRIENIPDDWVRVLRSYIARASVICFDVTPLDGGLNRHVLREVTYINGLILDWQANHYIPPVCLFMDLPGTPRISWRLAADVDPTLCGTASGSQNNLRLSRSVAVLDYSDPVARKELREHLGALKDMVSQATMPEMYNSLLIPNQMDHPVLKRTLRSMGFVPYYLRDEEYLGFELACTMPVEFDGLASDFWRRASRVLPFSTVLQRQVVDWISHPLTGLSDARKKNLLQGLYGAVCAGLNLGGALVTDFRRLLEGPLPAEQSALLEQTLNEANANVTSNGQPSVVLPRLDIQKQRAPQSNPGHLLQLTVKPNLLTVVREDRRGLWPCVFGPEPLSVQRFFSRTTTSPVRHFHILGEELGKLAITDGMTDLLAAAREALGQDRSSALGLATPATAPSDGRYFRVGEELEKQGIYEDAVDALGPTLSAVTARMKNCRYSDEQIERALRTGILVRLILTWSRVEGISLENIVNPYASLIEFVWGETNLELFEFQAKAQGRVNRAAIPWNKIRRRVIEYLAQVASRTLHIPFEEALIPYEQDLFPPPQIWAMLVATRMWEFCNHDEFREWWSKYGVCECINGDRADSLILDVRGIDRWAPAELA